MPSINYEISQSGDWISEGNLFKFTYELLYNTPDKVLVQTYELIDTLTGEYVYFEPNSLQIKENEVDENKTDIIVTVYEKPLILRLNILYGD
jgi:hypothetical protein